MKAQFISLLAAAGAASAELIRCATPNPNDTKIAEFNEAFSNAGDLGALVAQAVTVDTYVHVVTTSAKSGRYTEAMAHKQMSVMNEAYAPLGISFDTVAIDITVNNAWAAAGQGSRAELAMKGALRQGSYADLNLYFVSDLGGVLGFCYFPDSSPTPNDLTLDGCVNLAGSLPGGGAPDYDLGYTAVHETGHWFGLYHVFQGHSCSGSGDHVSDTPIQSVATGGCPASQDSCPHQRGADSIHNYMDYSHDDCLYEFTTGQSQRANALYAQYRAGK